MNNTIILKLPAKNIVHITEKKKLYKSELKKLLVSNKLIKKTQDFYINNEIIDFVRVLGNIELNITPSDTTLTKSIFNIKIKNIKRSKINSLIVFIILMSSPILIIILFDSELVLNISAWFLSIVGFLFFAVSMINQESNTYIEETNLKLSETNHMKSMFIANMSHELKTPIANILGLCTMLKDDVLHNNEELNNIELMATRLINMVNNILFFSQSSFEKVIIQKNNFTIKELINEIFKVVKMRLQEKNMSIIINNLPIVKFNDSFEKLCGDKDKISRVLINLLTNAIKFSENNSNINILINQKILPNNKIKLHFKVIDTGLGIPEDKITKIFLPFVQADVSTTRKYGGNGLGLAICSQIVHLMNGNILVSSKVKEGSTFEFYIYLEYGIENSQDDDNNFEMIEFSSKSTNNLEIHESKTEEKEIKIEINSDIDYKIKLENLGEKIIYINPDSGLLLTLIPILLRNIKNIKIKEENYDYLISSDFLIPPFPPQVLYKKLYEELAK